MLPTYSSSTDISSDRVRQGVHTMLAAGRVDSPELTGDGFFEVVGDGNFVDSELETTRALMPGTLSRDTATLLTPAHGTRVDSMPPVRSDTTRLLMPGTLSRDTATLLTPALGTCVALMPPALISETARLLRPGVALDTATLLTPSACACKPPETFCMRTARTPCIVTTEMCASTWHARATRNRSYRTVAKEGHAVTSVSVLAR